MARIRFKNLKIENINNSSGIFSGDNLQVKWKSYVQQSSGYGELQGNFNKVDKVKSVVVKRESK
ncbi:hypothetical protein U472_09615 [Orenia metallireducens]|jgi:hypothetical protein|uniref:Uncharacterized protein n=1 Tax=Orenia metallireducens TaxID=1413210 RepID=A0A1C0A7R5_9FIRM|nr:hypothetical protein [Orenia metallireducens]OCL26258.1 hypothetical protein U472_09615 [Orenia metallireducens]